MKINWYEVYWSRLYLYLILSAMACLPLLFVGLILASQPFALGVLTYQWVVILEVVYVRRRK